jgi:superfamily II DNA or RNA helicase
MTDVMIPREGMMTVVRNRRGMVMSVKPFEADGSGRFHLIEVEYTDGSGAESELLLWEAELGAKLLEPASLPNVSDQSPMNVREFDAMVRASRWSALTPSLPFSGLDDDRPPLASPLYGAIYPEAYQLVPVLKALQMPRVALMLADAVGLGKTIQAGMVLRELMLRRRIRRILIICPATLRTQWREEMEEKFSLPFEVVDRASTLRLQKEMGVDANPWRSHERIITSYHYLKQPDVLEQFRHVAEPGDNPALTWDLLIVDEAHNLAPASFGTDSALSKMLQNISPWFEHRLFLTATPHNGHTRSFSGLLEILDPVKFTRKSELTDKDRVRVSESVIRRLKSEINRCYTERGEAPRFSERLVEALPSLRFGSHERALIQGLRDFKRALKKALDVGKPQDRVAANFAVEVLQKRLLSGPWAFGQSWLNLVDGLNMDEADTSSDRLLKAKFATEDDTDYDAERDSRQRYAEKTVGSWLRPWREALNAEITELTDTLAAMGVERAPSGVDTSYYLNEVERLSGKVKSDARMKALEVLIDDRLRGADDWATDERLVIFTEYKATLDYITARLRARYGDGGWLQTLFGGMRDLERDAVKHAFNDQQGSTRILVATDAAGEGLNLQRAARFLLHWDIPWNPSRMEQRNGRLDRHGQQRDVSVFHFDSTDDASMNFLGKVLAKRSQTREDNVVTDDIFADIILAHFELDEEISLSNARVDRVESAAHEQNAFTLGDLPQGAPLPGEQDLQSLAEMKARLDLSPSSLRETLETALSIQEGRPRLEPDGKGRERFIHPVPRVWREVVDQSLRRGGETGALLNLVFDPGHYIRPHDGTETGRPVYTPEIDSRLLHLGDRMYHKVMSTFARYRFPGGAQSATRWTVREAVIPSDYDALILLTVEEFAVNKLREPCHHWVKTIVFPVVDEELLPALDELPASEWSVDTGQGDLEIARDLWSDVEREVKKEVQAMQRLLTERLLTKLQVSGAEVKKLETNRFKQRKRELATAIGENQREKLIKERDKLKKLSEQRSLFEEDNQAMMKALADIEAELILRRTHYEQLQDQLERERQRTLNQVIKERYALRGDARVYPIAIEIRIPGGAQ